MKHTGTRIFFILIVALLITSCRHNPILSTRATPQKPQATPTNPAEEILINNSRFQKPYIILGQVEYTLKTPKPVILTDLRIQAINALKNEAYARYGVKVDAIIDTKVRENTEEGFDDSFAVINVHGTAISFGDKKEKSEKHKIIKRKVISKKSISHSKKIIYEKPFVPRKTKPKEIEVYISPTEILK